MLQIIYLSIQSIQRNMSVMLSVYDVVIIKTKSLCVCVCVHRGFPIQKCIMLKHLSKEAEETPLGSQSPPAKRSCPDLQVNHKLKDKNPNRAVPDRAKEFLQC